LYDLRVLSSESEPILRGMTSVATGGGHRVPVPVERDLILAARRHLLPSDADVDDLRPVTPGELRALLPGEAQRVRAIRFMILVPYVSLEADAGKVATVDAFAMRLGIDPARLRALHRRREGELRRVALDALRRGWPLPLTVRTSSLLRGIVEAARRRRPDEALATRYRELSRLPAGSLGRALYDLHQDCGWALPGEIGGLDEALVASDLRAILAGLGPGVAGRTACVAFSAGLGRAEFGCEVLLEALSVLLASARLAAGDSAPRLDVAALVDAHARGRAARIDPALEEDWWSVAAEDVAELRARFRIDPAPRPARPSRQPVEAAAALRAGRSRAA